MTNQAVDRGRLWELSSDLLGILNAQGYFESTNPAWTTTLGWTSEVILETSIFELIHPDDVEKTRIGLQQVGAAESVLRFENRYRRTDGEYRRLSWVAVPEGDKFYCFNPVRYRSLATEGERSRRREVLQASTRRIAS